MFSFDSDVTPFDKEMETIDPEELNLADKEVYLMIGIVYQGKKYACSLRHDNTDELSDGFDSFSSKVALLIHQTAKNKGWVKKESI